MEFSLAALLLFGLTVASSALFYGRIRKARLEYEEAKDIVKSIVLSFSGQLSKQKRDLGAVVSRSELALEKSNQALSLTEKEYSRGSSLSAQLKTISQQMTALNMQVQGLMNSDKGRLEPTPKPEEASRRAVLETNSDVARPPRREGVLSQLNPTELRVLEMLDKQGEMTAPQIMRKIGKTREHTARLLKKVYEDGFIDRTTGSLPYKYTMRKELKELLKEQEKTRVV